MSPVGKTRKLFAPLLLVVVSILCFVVPIYLLAKAGMQEGISFTSPGEKPFLIPAAGNYALWIQNQSAGPGFSTTPMELPEGLQISMVRADDELPLTLLLSGGSYYSSGAPERRSFAKVHFPSAGTYRVEATGSPEKRTFYLAESVFLKLFLLSFALWSLSFIFFVTGIILVIIRISRSQHTQAPQATA